MSPPVWQRVLWLRSVLWLLGLAPFFFWSYGYANQMAAARGVERALAFAWEAHIPFVPWTIVPYWSIDLLYGLSFLCCRSARAVDRHALRLFSAQCLSVACFLWFPLRFSFERPPADGLFGALFTALTSFDLPYNQAPSLHISLLILLWVQFAALPAPRWARWGMHLWAMLIAVSVLTTWQHHVIDLPSGAAVGVFCLWLWPEHGPAPWRRQAYGHTAARARLGLAYALGAALCLAALAACGLPGFYLAWPALALALVAANYLWCGAAGFQKHAGRHSLASAWLFAPYTLAARLNVWLWTRHLPACVPVADGVWLGRMPRAAELRAGGFTGLCELCAELPAPRGPWRWAGQPSLDLIPPAPERLLAAARDIEALRQHGPVWVACALGHSRSACAVAAWLLYSGRAADVDAALAQLRAARPQVVIRPPHRAALQALATNLAPLTKLSEAALARRVTADSTTSTARSHNNASRVLLAALSQNSHMRKPSPSTESRALARVGLALCQLGAGLHRLSLPFTVAALLCALLAPLPTASRLALLAAGLAGLAETLLALRLAFDRPILAGWAQDWHDASAQPDDDMAAFDSALATLGLAAPTHHSRPLADRVRGVRRLLAWQGGWLAAQLLGWLASVWLASHG
ncbi:hypothetical protein [Rivihabitans pingtungensis]|uniref:hypothetical protein n=1 Tax=Rivihabitans pingtungensis TaxID=1054498 RepID=UPI00235351EA|nr:hypothetical protein [Rivihabitans pingtungensis]MCK6437205.1 hypothetical protein [Rivihabitans pingtungensis]